MCLVKIARLRSHWRALGMDEHMADDGSAYFRARAAARKMKQRDSEEHVQDNVKRKRRQDHARKRNSRAQEIPQRRLATFNIFTLGHRRL